MRWNISLGFSIRISGYMKITAFVNWNILVRGLKSVCLLQHFTKLRFIPAVKVAAKQYCEPDYIKGHYRSTTSFVY